MQKAGFLKRRGSDLPLLFQQPLHQQGQTIECLREHLDQLADACHKQILRVGELQSEDYHLDRQVYYACRIDRENLCAEVKAGDGEVYKCLFSKKEESGMSYKVWEEINSKCLMSHVTSIWKSLKQRCRSAALMRRRIIKCFFHCQDSGICLISN